MPDDEATAGIILQAELCEQAKQQPVVPLPEVYRNVMMQQSIDEDLMPPSYNSVKSQMHRARRLGQPPIPHRREDIIFTDDYKLTINKEQFLQHQENSFIIFSTDQNLQALSTSDTLYTDGTFKSAPQNFTQLYTIHATYRGHVIPVIYCLLSDKSSDTYHLIFDIIKRKMAALDVTFNPSTIISDFESSIIPTLRHHFPNT